MPAQKEDERCEPIPDEDRTHKGASRHQFRTRPLVGHLFLPVAFIATGMAKHAPNASLWLPVRNRLSLRGYESGPAAWARSS